MSLAHQLAASTRWYCPSCGEVRLAELMGPLRIGSHWTGNSTLNPEDGLRRQCPGGFVDREKDRAP